MTGRASSHSIVSHSGSSLKLTIDVYRKVSTAAWTSFNYSNCSLYRSCDMSLADKHSPLKVLVTFFVDKNGKREKKYKTITHENKKILRRSQCKQLGKFLFMHLLSLNFHVFLHCYWLYSVLHCVL